MARDLRWCRIADLWARRLMAVISVFGVGVLLYVAYDVATNEPPPRPEPYELKQGETPHE